MFAKIASFGVRGLSGFLVTAEADISGGLPGMTVVGLPDSAVKESGERVRSACKNLCYGWPASRITVNLAPADTKKTGPVYDLPLLLALMAAQGALPMPAAHQAFVGELGLDGSLRPVAGILPMALCAAECGITELFVPAGNAAIPCRVLFWNKQKTGMKNCRYWNRSLHWNLRKRPLRPVSGNKKRSHNLLRHILFLPVF